MVVRMRELGVGVNLNHAIGSGESVLYIPTLLSIYYNDVARAERALFKKKQTSSSDPTVNVF